MVVDINRWEEGDRSIAKGWIKISKPTGLQKFVSGIRILSRASSSSSGGHVSLDTPRGGGDAAFQVMEESGDTFERSPGGSGAKEGLTWILGKIIECWTTVGVMVDHIPGGWDSVVKFAVDRERPNREEIFNSKPKMKGVRELQNLSSSINYNKSRGR